MLDPRAIHIYTDGSCLKNPGGRGGAAAIAVLPESAGGGTEQIVDEAFSETTNNRMELVACIGAIEWIRTHKPWSGVTRVQIVTDSKYVRESLSRARDWLSNAGRNLHGEPKQNLDLWKKLNGALSIAGIRVDFVWELGKKSAVAKMVDKAAKAAAARGGLYRDSGFKQGKVSRSKVRGAATIYHVDGSSEVIHVYRKNSVSKQNQIRFHLFNEKTGAYSGSYYAYASDSLTSELHRSHRYRVVFNDDPRYPVIAQVLEEVNPASCVDNKASNET